MVNPNFFVALSALFPSTALEEWGRGEEKDVHAIPNYKFYRKLQAFLAREIT